MLFFSLLFNAPAGQRQTLHRAEYLRLHVGIGERQGLYKLLYFISLAGLVLRTGIFDNGDIQRVGKVYDLLLAGIDERTYLRNAAAIHERHRPEAAQPPLKQQTHEKRLDRIVETTGLTAREREILELWVTGHRLDYVAESLFISKNTVKTHLRHIYQKTQTGNKEELLVLFEQQA